MTNAPTPEDLEMALEDALLMGDQTAVALLFAEEAVLLEGGRAVEIRGALAIAGYVTGTWTGACAYLAAPTRVLQARDIALVITPDSVNVARRVGEVWKFVVLHRAGRLKGVIDGNTAQSVGSGGR